MERINLTTSAGNPIVASYFASTRETNKVLLISSATGIKQSFYAKFADFFSRQGFHVFTFDYEGVGLSKQGELRHSKASYKTWIDEDFRAMVQHIRTQFPHHKLTVIGHSSGGHALPLSEVLDEVDYLVTIGSQQGYWQNYPLWNRYLVWLAFSISVPLLNAWKGYFPASLHGLGDDLPKGVAEDWIKVVTNPQGIESVKEHGATLFRKLKKNILVISIEDDWLAPKKSVERLANECFQGSNVERLHIFPRDAKVDSIGHFGFFRSQFQDTLWQIPLQFFEQQHTKHIAAQGAEVA
jgi:predicted alpha/beta hydrolase